MNNRWRMKIISPAIKYPSMTTPIVINVTVGRLMLDISAASNAAMIVITNVNHGEVSRR